MDGGMGMGERAGGLKAMVSRNINSASIIEKQCTTLAVLTVQCWWNWMLACTAPPHHKTGSNHAIRMS
jgi:hypothetical protein